MQPWLPTALLSITIGAVGQLLLKFASRSAVGLDGASLLPALARLALNPYLILGLICFLSSMLLWVKVLRTAELSTAYPLVSLGYVLVAALSWVLLGERLGIRQAVAIGVIIFGVFLLGGR